MAFDANRAANKAADHLQALTESPVTDRARMVEYLTAIFQGMYDEQLLNVEILPNTFTNAGGPVTGLGKLT